MFKTSIKNLIKRVIINAKVFGIKFNDYSIIGIAVKEIRMFNNWIHLGDYYVSKYLLKKYNKI